MSLRILIFLLAGCFIGNATANDTGDSYTLYLVRHAEKQQDGSGDPELTVVGSERSKQLASWFHDKDIKDIWSSDYKRTRDTAKPLVYELGLKLSIYDPRDLPDLVKTLLHKQRTALVVGHSNTTPELARLLCDCFIEDMDESEYERLVVISVVGNETKTKILNQSQLHQE